MDEVPSLESASPWEIEEINDDDSLFRQVHSAQKIGPKNRRFPNEGHFGLKDGEEYLSFNWDRYIDQERNFKVIGLSHSKKEKFLDISEFTLFKYPVSMLRSMNKVQKVVHIPEFDLDEIPSPIGKPNNRAHAGLYCSENDLPFRAAMSDYCQAEYDNAICEVNKDYLKEEIEELKKRGNDSPFHKDWEF